MPKVWKPEYNESSPSFNVRRDEKVWAQLRELQSDWSDRSEDGKCSISEAIRRCIDLAHRNRIRRETVEPPEPLKPRCNRCGGELGYWHQCKPEQRERSQKSIQIEMEARQKFERLGLLPRSED